VRGQIFGRIEEERIVKRRTEQKMNKRKRGWEEKEGKEEKGRRRR
jgi:hypothetical protein